VIDECCGLGLFLGEADLNMQGISWKLGLFYIGTIGLAIGLFQSVSQYGEAQLKPQPKITGLYRLKTPTMPNCLRDSLLELEQSGRFINAMILPAAELPALTKNAEGKAMPRPLGHPQSRQQAMFGGTFASENKAESIVMVGHDRQVGTCFVTVIGVSAKIQNGMIAGTLKLNQENPTSAPPASVMNQATYNNGNAQTLTFWAEKLK
jgi:hypothetical protein